MRIKIVLLVMALMVFAAPMFAQEEGGGGGTAIPAVIGLGIAAGLCGIGQGRAAGSAVEGMARNPAAAGAIRITMIIGLAFIESLVLFTFVTAQ